jgi:hypothetical protein
VDENSVDKFWKKKKKKQQQQQLYSSSRLRRWAKKQDSEKSKGNFLIPRQDITPSILSYWLYIENPTFQSWTSFNTFCFKVNRREMKGKRDQGGNTVTLG